jgi:phage terminase large subunit-like protein
LPDASNKSLAERLASLPAPERAQVLRDLSEREAEELEYEWLFWARPNQRAPEGDWTTWLILAGRGFGKTRTGAEWVRDQVENCGALRVALVAPTAADARKVMVEGESGIMAIAPRWFRPLYQPSQRQLTWPNGAIATLYSAEEPERLRGPQHDAAWCDELAAWKFAREAFDMLQFGLRLGMRPRQVITTTPKPISLLKEIIARPDTVITRGTTTENAVNLAPAFLRTIVNKYKGTRLGRQELEGELLEEVEGALWTRAMLETALVKECPPLARVVVAIDPSGTAGNDEACPVGIVAAGRGYDGTVYILRDATLRASPAQWGQMAVDVYRDIEADRMVGERNFGGAMVEHVIRTVDPKIAYKEVTASRGKWLRAEPVAALYEQGRVKHVGGFPDLEDELCSFGPDGTADGRSPNRLDAMVWAVTELALNQGMAELPAPDTLFVEPFDIPRHWNRVYAIDCDTRRFAGLWGAFDPETNDLVIFAEYAAPMGAPAIHADAVRERGSWIPGLIARQARGRSKADGQALVDKLCDLNLNLFLIENEIEPAVAAIKQRVEGSQVKIFNNLKTLVSEYHQFCRDENMRLVEGENDHLVRALGQIALSGSQIAVTRSVAMQEPEDRWDNDTTRDGTTGY